MIASACACVVYPNGAILEDAVVATDASAAPDGCTNGVALKNPNF